MRKLLCVAVLVILAVTGSLPVYSAEPMSKTAMSSDELKAEVRVTISINENRGAGGWYGSYMIQFVDYQHPSGLDYVYLSSSYWMIQSNAEVAIPINGNAPASSGSFFLPDNPNEPNGYHNFAPYQGPPVPNPYGSLNVMLKGTRFDSFGNAIRAFTLELHIIDKRTNGTPPYAFGVSNIFMDYKTHLFTSDMN